MTTGTSLYTTCTEMVLFHNDDHAFVSSCLLCVLAKSDNKVLCTLSAKPNEIIHFDYLFHGERDGDNKYVLFVKRDFSGYCWLESSANADGTHAAEALARWSREFTAPGAWVFDQGSHFIEQLASEHRILHNFSVVYSPRTKYRGVLMRSVLSVCCAMLGAKLWLSSNWGHRLVLCHSCHRLCAERSKDGSSWPPFYWTRPKPAGGHDWNPSQAPLAPCTTS